MRAAFLGFLLIGECCALGRRTGKRAGIEWSRQALFMAWSAAVATSAAPPAAAAPVLGRGVMRVRWLNAGRRLFCGRFGYDFFFYFRLGFRLCFGCDHVRLDAWQRPRRGARRSATRDCIILLARKRRVRRA